MKITHICQYYNDGWGYQENLLPRYQKKLGHDIVVIASDRRPFYPGDKNKRIIGTGTFFDNEVRVERIPIKWELKNRFVMFKDLRSILEKEKPDYIFHHGVTALSLKTAVEYKKSYPNTFLVADSHSDFGNTGKSLFSKGIYHGIFWKKFIHKYINYIDKVFCVTPWVIEFEKEIHKIPQEKIFLLPLGADEQYTFDKQARTQIREEYNLDDDDFLIITAGKIDSFKKTDDIIMALKEIKNQKIKFMIIGSIEPNYFDKLKKLSKEDNRIIFKGWVEQKEFYKFFSAADLGIWPGGQSVIWQAAVSCGLPIVIKHWPYVEYMVENGNGLILYSDNYKEIKQDIEILMNSPEYLKEMRQKAILFSENYLSYSKIAEETLKDISKNKEK